MRKTILIILGFLLLILAIEGIFYLYQNSGYKEYRAALAYINSLNGDEKTLEYNRFFGIGETKNLHGGILAASWDYGILMWGINGLAYYPAGEIRARDNTPSKGALHTNLYYVNGGCAEALKELNSGNPLTSRFFEDIPTTNPFIEYHLHMYKWRARIHPGNYIQVLTNGQDNKAESVVVEAEFNGPKNWVICSVLPN